MAPPKPTHAQHSPTSTHLRTVSTVSFATHPNTDRPPQHHPLTSHHSYPTSLSNSLTSTTTLNTFPSSFQASHPKFLTTMLPPSENLPQTSSDPSPTLTPPQPKHAPYPRSSSVTHHASTSINSFQSELGPSPLPPSQPLHADEDEAVAPIKPPPNAYLPWSLQPPPTQPSSSSTLSQVSTPTTTYHFPSAVGNSTSPLSHTTPSQDPTHQPSSQCFNVSKPQTQPITA